MTLTVKVNDPFDTRRVALDLNAEFVEPQTLSIYKNNDLLGAYIVTAYTGKNGSCYLGWIGYRPGWFSRRIGRWVSQHLFLTLACRAVMAEIRSDNARALAIAPRIGFREIARVPGYYPDADGVLLAATPETTPFLS